MDHASLLQFLVAGFSGLIARLFVVDLLEAIFHLEKEFCISPEKEKELLNRANTSSTKTTPTYEPGTYNRFHSHESAKDIKEGFIRDYNRDVCYDDINKEKLLSKLNNYKFGVEVTSTRLDECKKILNYFKSIDAGLEPNISDKQQYEIFKNSNLEYAQNPKGNWVGPFIDFNNPENLKQAVLDKYNTNLLIHSECRFMIQHMEKENLLKEENYSKVSSKMTEFDSKFKSTFDKERKANLEALLKKVDSYTSTTKAKL